MTDYLDQRLSKKSLYPPLFPTTFDPDGVDDLEGVYSFGGQADRYVCPSRRLVLFVAVLKLTLSPPKSYYEYLVKEVQLLGNKGAKADQYARLVRLALDIVFREKKI